MSSAEATEPEAAAEARRQRRIELAATVLLAVAALATAWSTFQSTRWRGQQAIDTSHATAARIQSAEATGRAGQLTQIDIATFMQWTDAAQHGDRRLARFYRERFRDEFQPAFAAWLATSPRTNPDAPPTPFAMPQYRVAETASARRLNAAAGVASNASAADNEHADDYMLAVVLFASSLFFAGISTKLHSPRQREVLLALGWMIFIGTAAWVASSPINFGT